jgi:hypothetical protein
MFNNNRNPELPPNLHKRSNSSNINYNRPFQANPVTGEFLHNIHNLSRDSHINGCSIENAIPSQLKKLGSSPHLNHLDKNPISMSSPIFCDRFNFLDGGFKSVDNTNQEEKLMVI